MFKRFELLVGDKFEEIKNMNILVIGVGGVGSYVVESLVRCGIENITIVDNDIVDITNLNRQLMTNLNNIGLKKVDVLKERINSINKDCIVCAKDILVSEENIDDIITNFDYVVDAVDDIKAKLAIIKCCFFKKIKLISSMGMGGRMNPSLLEITDIYKTSYDPLAKIMRYNLRKMGIKKLTVVCSCEKIKKKVKGIIPSNSFVPASAGLLITSYIINDIVGGCDV